jgi:hypothetical protein
VESDSVGRCVGAEVEVGSTWVTDVGVGDDLEDDVSVIVVSVDMLKLKEF